MPTVNAIKVFDVPSDSEPDKTYRVQFDGERWFCECLAWRFNMEHKGEKGADGRSVPRECKHTRRALGLMQTKGEKAFRVIQPLGPWFEELQQNVGSLADLSRNGKMSPTKFAGFSGDLKRFREERAKVQESLDTVDAMLEIFMGLLKQSAEGM